MKITFIYLIALLLMLGIIAVLLLVNYIIDNYLSETALKILFLSGIAYVYYYILKLLKNKYENKI